MLQPRKPILPIVLLITLAGVLLGLVSCTYSLPDLSSGFATLSPAGHTSTAYEAAQRRQATDNGLLADKANAENMALAARQTSDAVNASETRIAAEHTQAVLYTTATAESRAATATARIVEPTLTMAALGVIGTQTAVPQTTTAEARAAAGTSTTAANSDHINGTSTAAAMSVILAQSTAEVERISNQAAVDRQTDQVVIWVDKLLPRLAISLIGLLLIWGAWLILRRLVPVLAAVAGIIRHGKDGKPNLVVPTLDGGAVYADLSRNDGPVLRIYPNGQTESPIQSSEPTLARAGLENLAIALSQDAGAAAPGRDLLRQAAKAQPASNARYAILPAGATPSLPADQSEIIEAVWRDAQAGLDWEQQS